MQVEDDVSFRSGAAAQDKEGRTHLDRCQAEEPQAYYSAAAKRQNYDPTSFSNFKKLARSLNPRKDKTTKAREDDSKINQRSSEGPGARSWARKAHHSRLVACAEPRTTNGQNCDDPGKGRKEQEK